MPAFRQPPFSTVVNAYVRQDVAVIARVVRESHEHLLFSAMAETNYERLAAGIYRLRYYLAEGAALHQWLALLYRTIGPRISALTALRREISFGWLLLLSDQPDSAAFCYRLAAERYAKLAASPLGQAVAPHLRQIELDLATGQFLLKSTQDVGCEEVHDALEFWQHHARTSSPDQAKRLVLALAALKASAGMLAASYANAYEAYYFYDARGMNSEAGLSAYYLAHCHAYAGSDEAVFEPLDESAKRWLRTAAYHWSVIDLPLGRRLIAPYLEALDMTLPPPRPMRRNPYLYPLPQSFN